MGKSVYSKLTAALEGAMRGYRRREIVRGVQMGRPFVVLKADGFVEGDVGDYLCAGADGDLYVSKREVFESEYELVETLRVGEIEFEGLRLSPGDLLLAKIPLSMSREEAMRQVAELPLPPHVQVIVIPENLTLEQLSDARLVTYGLTRLSGAAL